MKNLLKLGICLFIVLLSQGCKPDDGESQFFNINTFEQNLIDAFNDNALGWAYVISRDGTLARSDASGLAQNESTGITLMTTDTRVYIAGVSKFVTAVAALKIIQDDPDLTINDAIGPYLPNSWNATSEFEQITFRELLGHRSGLHIPNSEDGGSEQLFANLRNVAENEAVGAKSFEYVNINFSLFRVLIPNMLPGFPPTPGLTEEEAYAAIYEGYIQEFIFAPINLTDASLAQEQGDALLYHFPATVSSGIHVGDWRLRSASTGWMMSANQVARLMAFVWHSDELLNDSSRQFLDLTSTHLGLSESLEGDHGFYQSKGGGLLNTGNHAFIMNYPNGVQAVVLRNTAGGTSAMNGLMRDAFDDAWEFGLSE